MPADASQTCPRCGSELELAGAIGHAELRRCVKPGCQWVALVVEADKLTGSVTAEDMPDEGPEGDRRPLAGHEAERCAGGAGSRSTGIEPSDFVVGGVPR